MISELRFKVLNIIEKGAVEGRVLRGWIISEFRRWVRKRETWWDFVIKVSEWL